MTATSLQRRRAVAALTRLLHPAGSDEQKVRCAVRVLRGQQ
jgi:hypothetical protein